MSTRVPRPMGLTEKMRFYHVEENQELKSSVLNNIRDYLVNLWYLSNCEICGMNYSMAQLSLYLECDINLVHEIMVGKVMGTRIWDKDKQEEILNGLMGTQLMWTLEERGEIANQVEILKRSQGNTYKPFISSELRMAMETKMKATQNLTGFMKGMGGGITNIFAPKIENNETNNTQYIGINEAMKILEDLDKTRPLQLSERDEGKLFLEEHYSLNELPEVSARKQEGIDITKEGIDTLDKNLILITNDYEVHRGDDIPSLHEMRRSLELGIDEDFDPEFEEEGD